MARDGANGAAAARGDAGGALGLSTGLGYDPGIYPPEAEVLALAKLAIAAGGRYTGDMRSDSAVFRRSSGPACAIRNFSVQRKPCGA